MYGINLLANGPASPQFYAYAGEVTVEGGKIATVSVGVLGQALHDVDYKAIFALVGLRAGLLPEYPLPKDGCNVFPNLLDGGGYLAKLGPGLAAISGVTTTTTSLDVSSGQLPRVYFRLDFCDSAFFAQRCDDLRRLAHQAMGVAARIRMGQTTF